MSVNTGNKPRHSKTGPYTHECAYCGVTFQDGRASTKYCTFEHKQAASNKRFYKRHRKEIILRVMLHQTRQTKRKTSKAGSRSKTLDFDNMSNKEMLEYIRNNPHAVKAAK